jgi:hypothetical protein
VFVPHLVKVGSFSQSEVVLVLKRG